MWLQDGNHFYLLGKLACKEDKLKLKIGNLMYLLGVLAFKIGLSKVMSLTHCTNTNTLCTILNF